MSEYHRMRRQQLIREAEGYLELMTLGGERFVLSQANRDRLGGRALVALGKLDPHGGQRAHALLLTGLVYRSMGRFSDAIEPLTASSKLDRSNLHVWLALGWCYKRIGRVDMAIDSMQEAIAALDELRAESRAESRAGADSEGGAGEPDADDQPDALLHYNLACYWSLLGNVSSALRALAHAFELEPEYRERVAAETDFDPIRSHPDFLALIGGVGV